MSTAHKFPAPKFPIGTSDFKEVIQNQFTYVDKTVFIHEIMEDSSKVILVTRPRRFGKTLNMSMLYHFLNIGGADLFGGLLIQEHAAFCTKHQNKYPVVFLTFKEIKFDDFPTAYSGIKGLFASLYETFKYLLEGDLLSVFEKENFDKIRGKKVDDFSELGAALSNLMKYLHKHHGTQPILLLDEYDTPIQEAYIQGYYDKIISFMRVLLGSALKDNSDLGKAIITGITKVSQESMFSGLNNIESYSVLDGKYGQYFGFTEDEVISLLPPEIKIEPIRKWYNGYQIGPWKIYNPWSILSCLKRNGALDAYWKNTSTNALIFKLAKDAGPEFREKLEKLVRDIPQPQIIETGMTFAYLDKNTNAIWTLLLV